MSYCKWFLLLSVFIFSNCGNKGTSEVVISKGENIEEEIKYPKNVILMIGDGMGFSQITASMYLNRKGLYLEKFPVVGLQKTYSGDNLVTDSAAGATALACGVKTYNNGIGIDMDTVPVQSILELAEENNYATGMVVTSSVVHGTPAPFIAHVEHREFKEEIATHFLNTEIDFLVGGGIKYFENRESDDRNITKELKKKGYYISSYFKQDIFEMNVSTRKNFIYFTGSDDAPGALNGRKYLPFVSNMAAKYLRKKSDKGFFLMIEGSQIDWGGHANDPEQLIAEMDDFNKAVGKMLKFAKKDEETLLIVTADHESGGFSINKGSTRDELITAFTTNGHTADLIPVFAYGPQSELFHGMYDNTEINKKMKQAMRLEKKEEELKTEN